MKPTDEELHKIAVLEQDRGFKICGAKNRELEPCLNRAGKGTDHVGEGRCSRHGGSAANITSKNYKHGRYSMVKTEHPNLREKMVELDGDQDVFDLRNEILKLRALAEIMADQEEWLATAKMAVDVSKIIERLHNIEVGRRYVISIENVSSIIEAVQQAIFRHVPDEFTRHLIAAELNSTRLNMSLPPKVVQTEYSVVDG